MDLLDTGIVLAVAGGVIATLGAYLVEPALGVLVGGLVLALVGLGIIRSSGGRA